MRRIICLIVLLLMSACAPLAPATEVVGLPTQTTNPTSTAEATLEVSEQATPTSEATAILITEIVVTEGVYSDPCEGLGLWYVQDEALGEIKADYVGSWHAAPFVGAGYNGRFVFFDTGIYLFFPSQYECDLGDASCVLSAIEQGTWGVQDGQINLAKDGELSNLKSIAVGEVVDAPQDESPYPKKTTLDGMTYWQMSTDTNLWNPVTGELCDF